MKLFVLVCILISIISCKKRSDPRRLQFVNNSKRDILFYKSHLGYPDINDINAIRKSSQIYRQIKPGESFSYSPSNQAWESYFSNFNQATAILFVLDADSVNKYSNPVLYPSNINEVLKLTYLNMDTLIKNQWQYIYP